MKIILLLLSVMLGAFSQNLSMRFIRSRWRQDVGDMRTVCERQTGVKSEYVEAYFRNGEFFDDRSFKCQFYCYGDKAEIISPTGEVNVENWVKRFYILDHDTAVKCSNFTVPDLCEKADKMIKCAYNSIKNKFLP